MKKRRKIGMFEKAITGELGEMTSRQLSLQVSVSFRKHSDFLLRHGLAKCNTVLDVGTGNGDFCCRLAEIYPNIQFTGIDFKSDLIERAIQTSSDRGITNTNWIIGDISTHQLGRVESSFDGILLRYTDIHMPHIESTLGLLKTLLRPGGRIWIISVDLDHMYCKPPHEAFDAYKQGTERLYNKHGMDPHIGAKIPTMLRKADYNSVVIELDPKSPQDIGVKEYQEYMLNEAILFHHFAPTALSRADLEKIGDFVEHVVPLPDYYGTYGTVMIAAER